MYEQNGDMLHMFVGALTSATSLSCLVTLQMSHDRITPLHSSVVIKTVDMCTAGDPARIVHSGYPDIKGVTILDKQRYAKSHLDHLRKLIIEEPRGHHEMYGMIPVKSDLDEADMAVLFINSEGK